MKGPLCFIFLLLDLHVFANQDKALITGRLPFLQAGDSVTLNTSPYGINSFSADFQQHYSLAITHQSFYFKIPMAQAPLFFRISFKTVNAKRPRFISGNYFLEQGDDITIDEMNRINYVHFSGRGSQKLNIIYQLTQIAQYYRLQNPEPVNATQITRFFRLTDSSVACQLEYLNEKQNTISRQAYDLIKANILAYNLGKVAEIGADEYSIIKGKDVKPAITALHAYYKDKLAVQYHLPQFSNSGVLQYSEPFCAAIIQKYRYDSCTTTGNIFTVNNCYRYLKANFYGSLRDRLVTSLLYKNRSGEENILALITDALQYIQNNDFRSVLEKLKSNRLQGSRAYSFSLADTSGVLYSLDRFKGKAVMLDFWFTGCGACLRTSPVLKSIAKRFAHSNDVVFISICTDKDKAEWTQSVREGKYTSGSALNLYTMGYGVNHEVIKHYDITGYPALILINKEGLLMKNPVNPLQDNGNSIVTLISNELNNSF